MNRRFQPAVLLALGLGLALTPVMAEAASVKSVQTGTVTMTAATQTAAITTVDPSKSFVVCTNQSSASKNSTLVTCELSASSVTITAGKIQSTDVVRWYVVEFEGGVSVQQGLATYGSATLTMNVSLTAVDLSKSFVLISGRTAADTDTGDEQWTTRARLTSTTNLELSRLVSGSAPAIAWQVVQMEGASVQRGLSTIASGQTSTTATISSVDTTTSFLSMSRRADSSTGGVESRFQVRGSLTNATTATFVRDDSTASVDIAWEVVSLSDGSSVQSGVTTTPATTTATMSATLSAIDTSRSVPLITVQGGGGGKGSEKTLDQTEWTATLSSSTGLDLQRVSTGDTESVAWFVVQFFKCPTVSDVSFAAVNAKSGQAIVYWSNANPVLILRKTSAFTTEAPDNGKPYSVNDTIGAATVVYSGSVAETSFTQTGLTNGTTYHYKVIAKGATTAPCYAAGTTANAAPVTAPPTWSYMMAGGSMLNAGIAGAGTIYTASNASRMISLSTTDGTQSWTPVATTSQIQGTLTFIPISGGGNPAVIGGDQGGKVYSVNTSTGATNWSITLSGANAVQAATAAQLRAFSNAAFQATYTTDVVFAATRNASTTTNKLFAIKASDGTVLWTFNGDGSQNVDYISGMPYVDYARNRVYIASRAGASGTQNSLWVINSLNGALVASFALGHIETSPTLSYDGSTVWVGNTSGDLYALNAATLALKWSSPSALGTAVKGYIWEDFSTAGRLYFSTADGNVWCMQDPGAGSPPNPASPVWKRAVAGASTPLVLSQLFVGSSDGKVHQINMSTGVDEKQFTVDTSTTVGDPSTEDASQLFVGTSAGKLYEIPLPLP